jgi:hypothetical protein
MNSIDVRAAPLNTPTNLTPAATRDISGALTISLANIFPLYNRRYKKYIEKPPPK